MKTYVRIQDGIVFEVIPPMTYDIDSPEGVEPTFKSGDEVPIERRYHPSFIDGTLSWMIDVTNSDPMPAYGWTATQEGDAWAFAPPTPPETASE